MKNITSLFILFLSLNCFAQPSNDDCLNATSVVPDGSCLLGETTVSATDTWSGAVGCQGGNPNDHQDVWYSFVATGTQADITATSSGSWSGDIEITLVDGNCAGMFTVLDGMCGASPQQLIYNGLTIGNTYYYTISNGAGGTQGTFDVCTETTSPPAGCVDNDLCTSPEILIVTSGVQTCVSDCNTGASPGPDFAGSNCHDMLNETVWYSVTTGASDVTMDIDLSSAADLSDPHFTVYQTSDCNLFTIVECIQGTGGSATSSNIVISPSTTYIIGVSDATGDVGDFDFCVTVNVDNSPCNTTSDLVVTGTSMGSPITGPFLPGEVVSFCYSITDWQTGASCNYLSGIVPTFGDCWDASSFDVNGMPVTITTSLTTAGTILDGGPGPPDPWNACIGQTAGWWDWYNAGVVTYNNLLANTGTAGALPDGTPLPAGWFFTTNYDPITGQCTPDPTDPNLSYGDNNFPFCDNTLDWNICFDLIAGPSGNCTSGATDCGVTMQTYADGEIGIWNSVGCVGNIPQVFNGNLNCCPTITPLADQTVCDSYTLPAISGTLLSGSEAYFTGSNGTGTTYFPGDIITSSITPLYIYDDIGTCSDEDTVNITINTTPVADAPADVTACDGYVLPALSVGNYFSSTGGVGSIAVGTNITSTQTIFVYAETGTTPNCTDENSFTVTINTTPVAPTAGSDATYCDGDVISDLFAAGSGGTLTWYDDAGLSSVIGTGNSITPSNTIGTIIYYVTETLNGCEGPASTVTITINAMPTISSESATDVTACGVTDGTIDIVAAGGSGSYTFSIDGGATFTNTTGSFTGLDVNSYQVVVDDGNCQVTGSLLVISGPGIPPAPTAGTNATYCDGDPIADLTANADASGDNNNLTWYDDAGLTNIVQSGGGTFTPSNTLGTSTYYITETVAGCQSPSSQVTIIINPAPTAPNLTGGNTYCDGDPISDLQATAGSANSGTFYWFDDIALTNNVANGPVFTPSTSVGTQTYYVVDSLNGCVGPSSSVTLTINTTPSFTISSSGPSTCLGTDGQLTISGLDPNTTYDVDYTDNGTSTGNVSFTSDLNGDIIINGLDAGTYTSIIITLNGCPASDLGPYLLSDPLAPTFSISASDPTLCNGTDGQLTISGLDPNTNYDVDLTDDGVPTGNVSYTSDINGDIIITGLDAGTYTSIIVTLNNCSTADAGSYLLTDPPLPTFTISATDPTVCAGTDGQLIISGLDPNTTYDVDLTDDGVPTGNISYTSDLNGDIIITGLNAGIYTAITVTLNGCSTLDPGSFGLADPNAPSPIIVSTLDPSGCGTMDAEILIGNLDPNTTYDLDYNFNGSPIVTTSITTNASGEFLLNGLDEGTYDAFTLTLAGCVGNDAGVYVLAPVIPTILQPNGDSTYCEGQLINDLTAAANFGGTINWYDDNSLTNLVGNGNTFTPSTTTAGSYTYYVTETLNGCEGPDSAITVIIVPQPFVTTSADTSICNGDTVVIQIDSLSGGSQLTWSNGDTTMSSSVYPSSTAYFTVVVDDGLGCSATDSTLVTVNPSDDASFTLTDFCEGDANSASNIVTTGGDFFFNPPVSDGAIIDSTTAEISSGVGGTTYTIMYLTSGVCADSTTQNVTINIVPPAPTVGTDTSYCEGEVIEDLTASGTGGTISWYDDFALTNLIGNGTTLNPAISTSGTYTFYVNESNGNCTSEVDSVKVTINSNPVANFTASPSSGVIPLDVVFNNMSTGSGLTYQWDLGDNTTSIMQDPSHTYTSIGTFTAYLLVTDINGCIDETSTDITTTGVSVFVIPNIFTPNGDGVNDELKVIYENIESFSGFIANRWGEILYDWKSIDTGWNGRTKGGVSVPEGTYFYVITATGSDQVEYNIQGSFHLGR